MLTRVGEDHRLTILSENHMVTTVSEEHRLMLRKLRAKKERKVKKQN
jgi:hypothetical protein